MGLGPTSEEAAAAIILERSDLGAIAAYAAAQAEKVIEIFDRTSPMDRRPHDAIAAAWIFARGGARVKSLRHAAWGAFRAARETNDPAAAEAAKAAMSAAAAAFLHPLPHSTQVRHILGAAAHAARAAELAAKNDPLVGCEFIECAARLANTTVVKISGRYPPAPAGGGRTGELMRFLDQKLRGHAAEWDPA